MKLLVITVNKYYTLKAIEIKMSQNRNDFVMRRKNTSIENTK